MKTQYTQQDISLFFEQFKKLPKYYKFQRIQQLINNPYPISGKSLVRIIKPLNFFIVTTIFTATLLSVLVFSPLLKKSDKVEKELLLPQKIITETKGVINQKPTENRNNQLVGIPSESRPATSSEVQNIKEASNYSDTLINGQKYILDLSFDELKNLGFDIRYHVVFYRNINPIAKCYFSSTISNGIITIKDENKTFEDRNLPVLRGSCYLQRDTFPDNAIFFIREFISFSTTSKTTKSRIYYYKSTSNTFYPLFTSTLDDNVISLLPNGNFISQRDTLVPIVIRFSRLRCELKKDQIFWFNPTDDFFHKLPERYRGLKTDYDHLKVLKLKNPDHNFMDYKVENWVKQQLFPKDSLVDGIKFIVHLEDVELKRIGLFRSEKGSIKFNYITPWGRGSGFGGKTEFVDGKPVYSFDSTFYADFYPSYQTDTNGSSIFSSTTSKKIDEFLIENDILLPVLVKDPYKDRILWFTLCDSIWKILPHQYLYLKNEYERIMFNKSFHPNKDLVIFFREKMEKLDINVKILDLNKSELENLGFQFSKDSMSLECVYNKEWLQYKSKDVWPQIKEKLASLPGNTKSSALSPEKYLLEGVNRFDSSMNALKRKQWFTYFDLHENCPNQGYHFIFVTDTLGRHLHKFNTATKKMLEEQNKLNYLIPVLVRQSDYFREYAEDKIFWFTPTDEFFERLPARIRGDIQNEFNSIGKKDKTTGCTYFEDCKTTLELTDFKLYPNPATSSVTIEFNNPQEMKGTISIVNILGSQLKIVLSETKFSQGYNNYNLDLSGINPGIYLISIQTDKGFKTQRLIVSQ